MWLVGCERYLEPCWLLLWRSITHLPKSLIHEELEWIELPLVDGVPTEACRKSSTSDPRDSIAYLYTEKIQSHLSAILIRNEGTPGWNFKILTLQYWTGNKIGLRSIKNVAALGLRSSIRDLIRPRQTSTYIKPWKVFIQQCASVLAWKLFSLLLQRQNVVILYMYVYIWKMAFITHTRINVEFIHEAEHLTYEQFGLNLVCLMFGQHQMRKLPKFKAK